MYLAGSSVCDGFTHAEVLCVYTQEFIDLVFLFVIIAQCLWDNLQFHWQCQNELCPTISASDSSSLEFVRCICSVPLSVIFVQCWSKFTPVKSNLCCCSCFYLFLCSCQIDEADNTSMISSSVSSANSFTIYTNNRCLVVAASSPEEKSKWIKDIRTTVLAATSSADDTVINPRILYPSLKSNSTCTHVILGCIVHQNVANNAYFNLVVLHLLRLLCLHMI